MCSVNSEVIIRLKSLTGDGEVRINEIHAVLGI